MAMNIPRSHFSANKVLGSIGAGAIALDQEPTTSEPPAERVFRFPADLGVAVNGQGRVAVMAANGTSIQVRLWWFDDTAMKWFAFGAASTITVATTNFLAFNVGNMVGAKFFVQILANTGVEQLVYMAN